MVFKIVIQLISKSLIYDFVHVVHIYMYVLYIYSVFYIVFFLNMVDILRLTTSNLKDKIGKNRQLKCLAHFPGCFSLKEVKTALLLYDDI